MAAGKMSREFLVAHGLLKTAALLGGLGGTVLSLAALIGRVTANGWARGLGAVVVALVVPLLIVDRMLPENADPAR